MSFFMAASDPTVAFQIGSLTVKWYGLIIVFAMIMALIYVCREAKKINLTSDDAIELFLWIIPLAIVFARILYVIPGRVDEYFPWHGWDDFVRFIAIWDGGITIIGGLLGGVLGGVFFTIHHRKQVNFLQVADLVVVPLLAGQITGRLGNFINQEAFGIPITNAKFHSFPFGVYITRPSGVESKYHDLVYSHIANGNGGNWFCATFFYEMVWNFIGLVFCFIFWQKGKNKKYQGFMIIFYFFWYMLGRFWLEYLRIDAVPVTQVACAVIFPIAAVIGVLYILYCNSKSSYRRVRELAESGSLKDAPITAYDMSNYKFVEKLHAEKTVQKESGDETVESVRKNPLRFLYGKDEFVSVDFESSGCYFVKKGYKKRFGDLKKTAEYSVKGA